MDALLQLLSRSYGDVGAATPEAIGAANVRDPLAQLLMGAAHGAWSGATLPGEVYQGKVPMYGEDGRTNPEIIDRSAGLASLLMGGGIGGAESGGAIFGSGPARMRMIDNVDLYKELANQNRAKGWATGKAAQGHEFKRPDPVKGSWERHVAEAKAGWDGDKFRAVSDYQASAPSTISKFMNPEDWEFIWRNGGRFAIPVTAGGIAYGSARDN